MFGSKKKKTTNLMYTSIYTWTIDRNLIIGKELFKINLKKEKKKSYEFAIYTHCLKLSEAYLITI